MRSTVPANGRHSPGGHSGTSQGVPAAVPEESELSDVSPFATALTAAPAASPVGDQRQHPQQQHDDAKPHKPKFRFYCFLGCGIKDMLKEGNSGSGQYGSGQHPGAVGVAIGSPPRSRMSRQSSTKRPFLRKMGSHAYSDVDWFDAQSKAEWSGDLSDRLAEVDQLSRQISLVQHPGIPDPPLIFAGDAQLRFVPYPFNTSHFYGYWARDYDRSTPPPQPIDIMLGANWLTKRVHDSIPGALIQENDAGHLEMIVKPKVAPPGLNRYCETFDKIEGQETSWMLRRDVVPGTSHGRMYMTLDGTIVIRVESRSLMGGKPETILEEYWRLEEGGTVLVARQCCLHIPTGKKAVQFLVGIRQPNAPKGWA